MKNDDNFSIRYVSIQTGLKPHILRTWEKRYSAVVPRRTETNRRIYNSVDIYRLKLIKRAVESGHAARRHPAPSHPLDAVLPGATLRGLGRNPYLPGRVWQPRGQRAAPAATRELTVRNGRWTRSWYPSGS